MNIINPVSTRDVYSENDVIDFKLTFDGKSIKRGSLRVIGEVSINDGTNNLKTADKVYIDTEVGSHSFFQGITSSTDKQGVLESNNQYPRYVKSKVQAQRTSSQLCSTAEDVVELKAGNDLIIPALFDAAAIDWKSFSMKPDICLNKTDVDISSSKCGEVNLSVRLATNLNVLYGLDSSTFKYQLRNIQLQFDVVDMDMPKTPLKMETVYSVRNTVETDNTVIASTVPCVANTMWCNFHEINSLNNSVNNSLENQVLPGMKSVEFSYNSEMNRFISYTLDDEEDILNNYKEALSFGVDNNFSLEKLQQGVGFGIGLNFNQLISLYNRKFGLNIQSNVTSSNKYAVFMMFKALIEIM